MYVSSQNIHWVSEFGHQGCPVTGNLVAVGLRMQGLEFRSWWGAFSFREWDPAQTLQVGSYQAGRLGAFPVLKQTLEMPSSSRAGQANGLQAARNRQKIFSGGPDFRYEWLLLSIRNLPVPEHPASCNLSVLA